MTCNIVGCVCDYFIDVLETKALFAEIINDVVCCRECKHRVRDHKRKVVEDVLEEEIIRRIIREEIAPIIQGIREEIAPIKQGIKVVLQMQLDPWENIKSNTTDVVLQQDNQNIDPVSNFYGINKHGYCMVLGNVKKSHIICAHLWPKHTNGAGLEVVDLKFDDINNPRNFMRMHKTIKNAFDRKRFTFELSYDNSNPIDKKLKFKLLIVDPSLLTEQIKDNYNGVIKNWSELDGNLIHHVFNEGTTPFLRVLVIHNIRAFEKALNLGWIADDNNYVARKDRALKLALLSLGD